MSNSNRNVIVFGESGSGKSSLVNLILGQSRATVSDKAVGCTFTFQKYETPNFNLYDTVGLSEGAEGTVKQEFAMTQLVDLLKQLHEGVSLLIFVIEKGRIKESLKKNYQLFADIICMKQVPVVLAITHCEMETVPGSWWEDNKKHFSAYGMNFNYVVSGSAMQPSAVPEVMKSTIKNMNDKTVEQLLQAIDSHSLSVPWKTVDGWNNWLFTVVKGIVKIAASYLHIPEWCVSGLETLNFEQRLKDYFQSGRKSIATEITSTP